jgi:hypothetical protein
MRRARVARKRTRQSAKHSGAAPEQFAPQQIRQHDRYGADDDIGQPQPGQGIAKEVQAETGYGIGQHRETVPADAEQRRPAAVKDAPV